MRLNLMFELSVVYMRGDSKEVFYENNVCMLCQYVQKCNGRSNI